MRKMAGKNVYVTEVKDLTPYCLGFVSRHDVTNGHCRTCAKYILLSNDETKDIVEPVYPLKSTCIRGWGIQHDVGCYSCQWKRQITPCLFELTASLYSNAIRTDGKYKWNDEDEDPLVLWTIMNGYCLHCDEMHDVHPRDMGTHCSGGDYPSRPLPGCGLSSDHAFCRYHKGAVERNVCCRCFRRVHYQGQVQSNPSGNHSSTAMATGGSHITTINYYGANYTAANNPSQQTMDPSSIGTGIGSALTPASNFLASPTVEEMAGDMSDRLVCMISGNSAMITQEAAGGAVIAYGSEPCYLENQLNTVDLPTRPGPSCDRWYTLNSFPWSSDPRYITILPFPGVLSDIGVFGTNLQFHYLFRAGAMIHVQCNATQFHSGCLLVAVVPECKVSVTGGAANAYDATDFFRSRTINNEGSEITSDLPIAQLMVFPHQLINLRTTNSATIVMAYNNITPASCFTTHNLFRIVIVALTPLRVPSGNEQEIPITVSICPLCSQFNGLRNSVVSQGLPVFEVPGTRQFGSTLANDGFPAFPVWEPIPEFPLAGQVDNFLSVARIPTLMTFNNKLYVELENKSTTNPRIFEMDLSLLANEMESTYVSRLARMFSYYRGTINFKFTFVGPKQSTGKLLVAYTPPGASRSPNSIIEAMQGTHVVWDLGLQSTLSFPTPFVSVSPYRYTNTSGTIFSYNGWISVWYQTNIVVAPGCANKCSMYVTACAGSDFEVKGFMDTAYYQGLGDQLTSTIQSTIQGQINNTVQTLEHNLSNPSMGSTEAPAVQHGSVVALEASETGASTLSNPSAVALIEPGSISLVGPCETGVNSMMSRYFLYDSKTADSGQGSGKYNFVSFAIDWDKIRTSSKYLTTLFSMATYWRFDMDFVLVVSSDNTRNAHMTMMYSPPGSYVSAGNDDIDKFSGVNPKIVFRPTDTFPTLRVPYMAPTPFLASHFDGFAGYNATTVNYGTCPSNNLGHVLVHTVEPVTQGVMTFNLYVRLVGIKCFMPRPIVSRNNPRRSTHSRGRFEVGDAENFSWAPLDFDSIARYECEDPLPLEMPEGPDMDGMWLDGEFYRRVDGERGGPWYSPWYKAFCCYDPDPLVEVKHQIYLELSDIVFVHPTAELRDRFNLIRNIGLIYQDPCLRLFFNNVRRYVEAVFPQVDDGYFSEPEYQGIIDSMKDRVSTEIADMLSSTLSKVKVSQASWWVTAMGIATKFIAFVTIVARNSGDPATLAAVGALVTADLVEACPFDWMRKQVCDLFGLKEYQGPTETLRFFNNLTSAAKGIEYLVGKLSDFVNWLKNKVMPQMEEIEANLSDAEKLVKYMQEWREYSAHPEKYTESSVCELIEKFLKTRALVEKADPSSRILTLTSSTTTAMVKAKGLLTERCHEPLGVLIHGSPGVGKSIATNMIGNCMSRFYGGDKPYSLPPDPKYFDNYLGQPVCIMDDLGQNPDGEDMKMICQMISSTNFITPQADLQDKGRPFTSRLVLASTNAGDLNPPTVSHLPALRRRFKIDVDMIVMPSYKDEGKLDVDRALEPCDHESICFKKCCPMICGKAVTFKDRKTGEHMSMDVLVMKIRSESRAKVAIAEKIKAFYEGPVVRGTLRKLEDLSTMPGKPLTKDMLDLIAPNGKPIQAMVQYAHDLGYDVPSEWLDEMVITETRTVLSDWKQKMLVASALVAITTTILLVWKCWPVQTQGPYSGLPRTQPNAPVRRVVEAQGATDPSTEFAMSLMKHNLFPIETGTGRYTAVGIYDRTFIIPRHAAVQPYFADGKQLEVVEEFDLTKGGLTLEITVVKCGNVNQFRDIRHFMKGVSAPVRDTVLAVNSDAYPRVIVPIKRVCPYGNLNIEGNLTARTLYYTTPTRRGYCGGLVVAAGHILGMHIAGDGVNGYSAMLSASYFSELQGEVKSKGPSGVFVNVPSKTKFEPSVFHKHINVTKEPAVLSDKDPRTDKKLSDVMFEKYQGNFDVENQFLEVATDQYIGQLATLMPPNVSEPITLQEAVFGYGQLDGLDLSTSAGYPYCLRGVKKRDLVENNCSLLVRGLLEHGTDLPYVTFLKDELRPKDKILAAKTRLIECSSINDTVNTKMVCGRFFEAILANPGTVSGSAVGCDPDVHWTTFAKELGSNVISFDYKNFDASLSPGWFTALGKILSAFGINQRILGNVVFSKHLFKDIEYFVEGGMPSGCSGTSIFNSLINNLIIKTLVLETYKGIDLSELKILAYGDDVVFSYPFPLEPEAIARTGRKYGLVITPADKSETFTEPGPIENHTFLKRGFKRDTMIPALYHPVYPVEEALQSLAWTKDASNTEQHVNSLLRLVWHGGRDDYDAIVRIVRMEPIGKVLNLVPYEVLRMEWYDKF